MNPQRTIVETNGKPKDAFTEFIERAKNRALLSPSITGNAAKEKDLAQFVEIIDFNALYVIYLGVIAMFYEDKRFGAFYPHWIVQSAFVSKSKKTPVKLNLLTGKQRTMMVELHHKVFNILTSFSRNEVVQWRSVQRTAVDLEWRVPFSEQDIELLDTAFKSLVRRNKDAKTD